MNNILQLHLSLASLLLHQICKLLTIAKYVFIFNLPESEIPKM